MQSDFILQVITSSVVSIGGSAGIIWLTKQWISERLKNAIKNEYDLKLETHKAQLKAQSDVEIERLRSQLNLAAKEHDVIFSRLHEKRGEVISKIYAGLRRVHLCLSEYVKVFEMAGEPSRDERWGLLADAHKDFHTIYTSNVIFLPKPIADKLDAINKMFVQTGNEFNLLVLNQQNPNRYQSWTEISERLDGAIKLTLHDLEAEFRRLLGDRDDETQP